jgi:hypothetical protein
MANKCKVCGQDMRLVPAGVSKSTGKPYQAFESCPNRCKQPRENGGGGSGDIAFKIMSDKFIELINKVDELIVEIRNNVIG